MTKRNIFVRSRRTSGHARHAPGVRGFRCLRAETLRGHRAPLGRTEGTGLVRDARRLAVTLVVAGACAIASAEPQCAIPGDALHWVADYCMATLETDDEIAASDCIAAHPVGAFASACAAKVHFKRELCRLLQAPGAPASSIERCVADPAVVGRTVREGGVGGR